MIRLTIPPIEEVDLQAVREVLETGYLVQGPRVAAFERVVADYVGCQHAVAVSSCTAALHLALLHDLPGLGHLEFEVRAVGRQAIAVRGLGNVKRVALGHFQPRERLFRQHHAEGIANGGELEFDHVSTLVLS